MSANPSRLNGNRTGYAILEFLALIFLSILPFFGFDIMPSEDEYSPEPTASVSSPIFEPPVFMLETAIFNSAEAIAAAEDAFFSQNGRYATSHQTLVAKAGLVLDPDLCYGPIVLQNSNTSYHFSVGSPDRDRFPIAYSYYSNTKDTPYLAEVSGIGCVSINGKPSYEAGPSEETVANVNLQIPKFKDVYQTIADAENEIFAQHKRYTTSYEELVEWGAHLYDSICYSEIELRQYVANDENFFRFYFHHVNSNEYPYGLVYAPRDGAKISSGGINIDCLNGSKRAKPKVIPATPAAPPSSPAADTPTAPKSAEPASGGSFSSDGTSASQTPSDSAAASGTGTPSSPADADGRAKAAYEAVAKAETNYYYKNSSYTDSYIDLVRGGFLTISDDICYGAIEKHYNSETFNSGFKLKVRHSKIPSRIYSYDSTLSGERASVSEDNFLCVVGSYSS
ncbi:MAG: hypothetical protein LBT40_05640 [Deltaproteobacteria bacterium]|jgi:hypothetical protein|nr:hypothetical protein [Deltaproteobacteria bacterium]